VDFLHYVTRINCLNGAIISETHTTNKYIYITKYDPPQCYFFLVENMELKNYLTRKEFLENCISCKLHQYPIKAGRVNFTLLKKLLVYVHDIFDTGIFLIFHVRGNGLDYERRGRRTHQ
jgi:hypothetical protein